MTDLNTNQNNTLPTEPTRQDLLGKIKPILIKVINKFKESKLFTNKLIFWSITIFACMVLFIIIIGLLFGKKKNVVIQKPTPSVIPFILKTPTSTSTNDILSKSQEKLILLKSQLDQLDVMQGRLQPPTLNFDIKF